VFVRCLEPPQIGTSISMRLYLPGRRDGLQVDGLVEEVAAPGREAGFWAAFRNLEPPARVEIVEVIARRERASDAKPIGAMAVQPDPEPRRAFPRYNARFAVRFSSVQEFVLEYAANISAGGLFVQTDNPPPLKTTVRVEMELPGGGPPVPAKGLVVHRVTKEDAQKRGTAAGVGLQFVDADDSFRGRIDAAIEHILKDQK
jgi:type IV pilus assembly protein PilZ